MDIIQNITQLEHIHFILTLLLSFLTGLEVREYKHSLQTRFFIGTVRTNTLIGMWGYLLYTLDFRLYMIGWGMLGIFFGLFYWQKLIRGHHGIITLLVACIVYTYPPLIATQPLWFVALIFVSIVFIVNAKTQIQTLMQSVDSNELVTFAKLVLVSMVIWPLLPETPISQMIPLSLSKIWMSVVVVSGISYVGYVLQRYFFRETGILLNGVLGGIYSSTATTIVLSRASVGVEGNRFKLAGAIVIATGMMYLRLIVIFAMLNWTLCKALLLPLGALALVAVGIGGFLSYRGDASTSGVHIENAQINPLEFGVAFMFALIFVVMNFVTHYFIDHYGVSGLGILAFLVGFTDIDPFILSLINDGYAVSQEMLVASIFIAIGSNNLFKGLSALSFASPEVGRLSAGILGVLSLLTWLIAWIIA